MTIAIAVLIAVIGHFAGPALGVWLATLGLGGSAGLVAGVATDAIEAAAGPVLEQLVEVIPHGPLTEQEQQTQANNLQRNRFDLAGPMG